MPDNPPPSEAGRVRVRWGGADDYPAALAIQQRAYAAKEAPLYGSAIPPLAETPATLAEEIAGGARLLVAEIDGAVVGSLRLRRLDDGTMYFGRLSVDPDRQGRGIGQRLARAVEELHPDAPAFALDCGVDSAENLHIYEKLGYRPTGQERQVLGGPLVVAMRKLTPARPA